MIQVKGNKMNGEIKGKIAYVVLFVICEFVIILSFIIAGILFK